MHKKCFRTNYLTVLVVYGLAIGSPLFAASSRVPIEQVRIVDESMCCAGCARKISGKLYAARGVKEVGVDLKSHLLTVSLPQPTPAMLGQLWQAVEQGDGTPSKLVTAEATYTLVRPKAGDPQPQAGSPLTVVIDNLHCQSCANKIAAQLYTLKGVTKVSADMAKNTLFVETNPKTQVSPWAVIDAVAKSKERPLAIIGSHGKLAITWATKAAPKDQQQAQQPNSGGIQR